MFFKVRKLLRVGMRRCFTPLKHKKELRKLYVQSSIRNQGIKYDSLLKMNEQKFRETREDT